MTLKAKYTPLLIAFLLGQVALLLVLLGQSPAPYLQDLKGGGVAGSLAMIVAFVLSDVLGDLAKARLVFWKWLHPLPGCEAFSRHMHADDRIDPRRIECKHGPLPSEAAAQNRLWYSAIFKTHQDKPALRQSHGRYLLFRELAALSALLALALGLAVLALPSVPAGWRASYATVMVLQYVVIAQAAANAGVRMVKNALAEDCA